MTIGPFSPTVTRLAAAALLTAGLALGIGASAARADAVLTAPTLVSVTPSLTGTSATLTYVDRTSNETNFTLYAHATLNDGREEYNSKYAPAQPFFGTTATQTIEALDPGVRYCFSVRAERNVDPGPGASPRSNEICKTMPTLGSKAGSVLNTPAGSILDALRPDLVAVRVTGATSLFDGETSVYEVVIRNDGAAAKGNVQLAIVFGGAVQSWEIVDTPAGFNCDLGTTITCQGSLGGDQDPLITRVANFQVRAWANGKGAGSITATVDPQHTVTETNESNNTTSASVSVK